MKSNIIPAQQTQLKTLPRLFDQFAKRAVLSKLEKIDKGQLQIIDDKQIYEFGDPDKNPIKATITVRNSSFYSAIAFGGSVGSGESYFAGDWDCALSLE